MNDLTTAFAAPKSEGNAQQRMLQKHSAVSRGEIAESVVRWLGGSVG